MYTFRVVTRKVTHVRGQITADVVRNDGLVVRSGMWPDFAEVDCALLNESQAQGWTSSQYFAQRAIRMEKARKLCSSAG